VVTAVGHKPTESLGLWPVGVRTDTLQIRRASST
jgi:hypothetical protein